MKNEISYNIGLDIGVASVGVAVTDEENNLLKRNNKNMWLSRIFTEAKPAKDRRMLRGARRRIDRKRERINILKSLIQEDMEKEYPNFFQMLKESSLIGEEKIASEKVLGIKYNIFSQSNYTDKSYYEKYPTIYHLRKYLTDEEEKVDIRLVYLAIHHIIKYRGNFLYEGEFSENTEEVEEKLDNILKYLKDNYEIVLKCEKKDILELLIQKNISKSNKKDRLITMFDYLKDDKQIVVNIVNSILGYSFELTKIFDVQLEKSKISFATEIENEEEIKSCLEENLEIYENMNSIYSWYILQDILNGKKYISEAFIEKYNKYSKDLKLLKEVYKQYLKDEYNDMFKKVGTNNYVSYNGKNRGKSCKKCKPEDFFNELKKKIETLPESCEEKEKILKQIADNNFLRKINVIDNGAIPHQLHERELKKILDNQSKYYCTLKENKEKIVNLFSFRIPYYVGPLSKNEQDYSWVVRKSDEKIRPWNFTQVVDEDATAEKFIKRMTNKCTYILNEDVMPKNSLLYSKFCVLNELNNIRVDNKHLSKDTKNIIIEKLFKKYKKVTASRLKDLLKAEGISCDSITGISDGGNFNSSMSSYIDMKRILGKVDESNFEKCEKLIYWITIFEEKKILKRKIEKEYPELKGEQITELIKLRYTGWSRLSKELIEGLKSNDNDSIIDKLEKTSLNFMQIINEKEFGFDKKLSELMPKVSKTIKYEDVAEIATSPANKRAIWQTICIIKEITKIMGCPPKNIYIEFARSEEKKVMKDNRTKQLLKKYEEIEKQLKYLKDYDYNVYKELKAHQNDKTLTEKMYLYYIQNGKCLYSGRPLDIDKLNLYEVDHIMPQSYIKDDSIDNKALVIKEENQRKKDNLLLSNEIINNRKDWWKTLLDSGLITQNKFYRLIRRNILETDDEREKFVQRQLVETRQIIKYVTNLLSNEYKDTNIFAIRAELTHKFRKEYKLYKNRNVNNYHHAHDAYILSTIGNIIDKNWKGKGHFKYSEYVKDYYKDEKAKKYTSGFIMGFINKYVDINKIKKVLSYKDCFITRMLEEDTGEFYNQTLYSPKDKPVIGLKENLDTNKYGGYSGENKAYYTIYEYTNSKGKKEYQLIGIPIKIACDIKSKKINLEMYIKNEKLKDTEYTDFKITRNHILKNQQYLDENNELMRFCSDREIRPDKELIVSDKVNKFIYLMNLLDSELTDIQREEVTNGYIEVFDYLIEKIQKEYKSLKNSAEKILNKKDRFIYLEDKDKKTVINAIIDMIETKSANLKLLGLSSAEGRMHGKNFNTEKLLKMTFIDKSVTGMYERRYRVNGMENNSDK